MGALGDIFGNLISKGAEKFGDKLGDVVGKAEVSSTGKAALNLWGNQEWELNLTEGGRAIKDMHNDYIRVHDQTLNSENAKLKAVRDWYAGDSGARKAVPAGAKLNEFHNYAVAAKHPIQNITQQIVSAGDGKLTQRELMIKNQQTARLNALGQTYGHYFENAAPIIAGMLEDKDPRVVANAHRVADIISNQVRDTRMFKDFSGGNTEQSAAKVYMNRAFKKANKIRKQADISAKIPSLDTAKTYTKQSETERKAHRVLNTMLIPFVALPHIGQIFNLPASSPLKAIGASLLRLDHDEMEKTVEASGIVATTMWSAMYRDILGETGKVAEFTNSPTVGKLMARTIHEPGFSFVRRTQLNLAGTLGFHSAIYWAKNFAESGSKIAEARLKELNIDPAEVLKQGGTLNESQLQAGVYHYVNNRLFFQRSIDNSLWQNKDVFTRAVFMYHSFVNSQVSFMRRELMLMAKAGDIKGIAQFAGTLGVLFPAVAPLIGGAEILLRTGSPAQAARSINQRYSNLFNPDSPGTWVENYFDLLSHLGAAGVYFNYINAIKANRLASAIAGPMVGAAATDITDIYHAAFMPAKSGKHNVDPLMRDVLKQTLPVVGSPLAHSLFPTTTEQRLDHPSSRNRLRRSRRGRRRF